MTRSATKLYRTTPLRAYAPPDARAALVGPSRYTGGVRPRRWGQLHIAVGPRSEVDMRALLAMSIPLGVVAAAAVDVPKTWDEGALRDWATPVAGLDIRPAHFSEEEYYRAPVDNLRTYPVYTRDASRRATGTCCRKSGRSRSSSPRRSQTDDDWVRAGKRSSTSSTRSGFARLDPKAIALARRPEVFARRSVKPMPDGTLDDLRWVPTSKGVALGLINCTECHIRVEHDGTCHRRRPEERGGQPARRLRHRHLGRISAAASQRLADHEPLAFVGGAVGEGRHS